MVFPPLIPSQITNDEEIKIWSKRKIKDSGDEKKMVNRKKIFIIIISDQSFVCTYFS